MGHGPCMVSRPRLQTSHSRYRLLGVFSLFASADRPPELNAPSWSATLLADPAGIRASARRNLESSDSFGKPCPVDDVPESTGCRP